MVESILIIDDDEVFCKMLTMHFEDGYAVTAFSDPEDAVRYIRENHVEVIVTDLSMPKIDGIGILQIVKSESLNTDVIIMSGSAKVESAVEAMKKGAYAYIVKPLTTDELSLHLKNVLERRRHFKEDIIGESDAVKG